MNTTGRTAVITGVTGPLGSEVARELAGAGAQVIGIGRDIRRLENLEGRVGSFTGLIRDAADPGVPGEIIDWYKPDILVLIASAPALPRTLTRHTWETFSATWNVDVASTFHWVREALLAPLAPGSTVVAVSSTVSLTGAPLSVGFASGKAATNMITKFAAAESGRAGTDIRFVAALPGLMPETPRGRAVAAAYAALRATAPVGAGPARQAGNAAGPPTPAGDDQQPLTSTAAAAQILEIINTSEQLNGQSVPLTSPSTLATVA